MEEQARGVPAVEGVDVRQIGAEIAALSARIDVAIHHQLHLIYKFDESEGWAGHASCAAWLSWRTGLSPGAARERVRVARALQGLPKIDAAFARGDVSYSKVRAMTRVATPEREEHLLNLARYGTAQQLEKACRLALRHRRQAEGEPEGAALLRYVTLQPRSDGTVQLVAQLLPDEAQTVMLAIEAVQQARAEQSLPDVPAETAAASTGADVPAETPASVGSPAESDVPAETRVPDETLASSEADVPAETPASVGSPAESDVPAETRAVPVPAQARPSKADALVELAGRVLAGDLREAREAGAARTGGDRADVSVHLSQDVLGEGFVAELEDGTHVPAETFRRLACDTGVVLHLEDQAGQTLDVGRKTRSIPPAIRRALRSRQSTCAFPGCSHRRFLDAHHVEHWLHGGETRIDNLVHLCSLHHRLVHEDGYQVALGADGRALFRTPDGHPIAAVPSRPRLRGDAADRMLDDFGRGADIPVEPDVRLPQWQGDRPDYGLCVGAILGPSATGTG